MINTNFKHTALVLGTLFIGLFAYSCGEIFGESDAFLKVTINGEPEEWTGAQVNAIEVDTVDGVYIQAIRTQGLSIEQMSFTIINFDGVGVYDVNSSSTIVATYSVTGTDNDFEALGAIGKIEVTSFEDNVIDGTVTFDLQTTDMVEYKVTNGSFKVKIAL